MKGRKKKFLTAGLFALSFMALGAGALGSLSTETASALTYTTSKYLTVGTTNDGDKTSNGCPSNFKIYMYSSSTSGSSSLGQDVVTNWSMYHFYIDASDIDHKSFKLYKNGSLYTSKSLSGSGDMTMYSAALSSGDYELKYTGEKVGFLWITTTYTYSYRFIVDVDSPSYTLKAGGTTISSGSYTNKQVVYTASDNRSVYRIRYRRPNNTSYSNTYSNSYTVSTSATNGWYYVYAEDYIGNTNSEVRFYLDTVSPIGSVTNASGATIANGGYTNSAIKYTATDSGSGVSGYQYKKPGATTWSSYTSGTAVTGTGLHTFRSYDRAGNYSEEYKVYYDTSAPSYTLYGGTVSKPSGSYTNAEYVKYVVSDSSAGLQNCYVRMPNTSYYSNYASGTQLATEGLYYFYAVDKSGNATATVNITLDKTKPTGTLYAGGSAVSSGTATNASYIKFVPYDLYGVANTYVKKPGESSYVSYTSGTQFTAEGVYNFYSVDRAGNSSQTYTITLDRKIPAAQLYVDDNQIGNNSYTNGAHIRFECDATTCYVKTPDKDTFSEYISGMEYYKPGKYVFYGETESGTRTEYYTLVIDRTVKTLELQNVKDGRTNGDVVLQWTDGDFNVYAPVVSVTINGKPYTKDQIVYTMDTGKYEVVCTDAAGNVWETSFVSTKPNVLTKTFQKEYYEAHDANGNYYTFASYESAIAFAVARELSFVRTGEWHNTSWDTGIAMDSVDSVNAVNGTYFIYKKSGVLDEEVAYFTKARLDEVIAQYAKVNIKHYYYWEKEYAPIADGENLFGYSDSRSVLANSIKLCENIGCLVDGEEFIGTVYEGEGKHVLTVFDEWGNTCDYNVTVVRRAADIRYTAGEGNSNLVVYYDRVYRFKETIKIFIEDENDEFAMFSIYNEDGDLLGNYHLSDVVELTESGSYTVVAINHFGESQTFQLMISRFAPEAAFEESVQDKKLNLNITQSTDDESHIQTLEIYKSTDNGETWMLLSKDDYGTLISLDTLKYAFRTSGSYRVVITDEFRTGIDAITVETYYVQEKPHGVLSGVEDGGYTNGSVTFTWNDEAKVSLWRDGVVLEYKSGTELIEDGAYVLIFENYDGFMETYEFAIDTNGPELLLEGVKMQGKTQTNVRVHYTETEFTAKLYKDGKEVGDYASGTEIVETGSYVVRITDSANNMNEVAFIIDKKVDYSVNVNDKGLANTVTITGNEEVFISMTKGEAVLDYALGTELTEPGKYNVTIQDLLGNSESFSFIIIEPKQNAFTHNFDDVPGFEMVVMNGAEKRLNYGTLELFEEGVHEVGVIVNGKTYSFTVEIDATAPTLTLNGVENGGVTKESVTITDISETADVKVYLNGKEISYKHGDILKAAGKYKVVARDECGNFNEYSFEIEKTIGGATIALIAIGGVALVGGIVFFVLKKKKVF